MVVRRSCRMILMFLAVLGVCIAVATEVAQAQVPGCPCKFKEPPWEAYGTKAACTTIIRKGGTSCEVEFGGISADPRIVAQVLGIDPAVYSRQVYDILGAFLQFLRDNKREVLADPKFLSTALPIFMRGVYLRRPLNDEDMQQVKLLDAAILTFLEKYSGQVAKAFLGGSFEPVSISNAKFTVGRGFIVVDHPFGLIITRYMPAE